MFIALLGTEIKEMERIWNIKSDFLLTERNTLIELFFIKRYISLSTHRIPIEIRCSSFFKTLKGEKSDKLRNLISRSVRKIFTCKNSTHNIDFVQLSLYFKQSMIKIVQKTLLWNHLRYFDTPRSWSVKNGSLWNSIHHLSGRMTTVIFPSSNRTQKCSSWSLKITYCNCSLLWAWRVVKIKMNSKAAIKLSHHESSNHLNSTNLRYHFKIIHMNIISSLQHPSLPQIPQQRVS